MTDGVAKTLTGIPLDKVAEKLNEALDPRAYKELPHRKYLTDIDPAYLREKATEVFGLCGYGWFYDYSAENVLLTPQQDVKGRAESYDATIKHFWLRYRYLDEDGHPRVSERIPSAGGSKNSAREEALKGAITNCLGNAFSKLCWQLDVYKGLRGANGKTKKKAAPKKKESEKPQEGKYTATELRKLLKDDPTQIQSDAYFDYAYNSIGMSKEDALAILEECDNRYADALMVLLDQHTPPNETGR